MNAIFKKLNFKGQTEMLILNAPDSFIGDMKEMEDSTEIKTSLTGVKKISFVMAFVTKQKEIDSLAPKFSAVLDGDGVLWFAYPKGTSKKYTCEFNRDTGWNAMGAEGFEGVRMVAIDEDWSALRFRRVEYIKSMTRSDQMAISKAGKKRAVRKK